MYLKKSFDPISYPEVEILILGSLPGDASLGISEYYGHPQNRFWKVLAAVYKEDQNFLTDYAGKLSFLKNNKIAVWDVIREADRIGSLDSSIKNVKPNPIHEFIKSHKCLKKVIFNGKKAEILYDTFFKREPYLLYFSMPSTSPANRKFNFIQLVSCWEKIQM